VIVRLSDFKTNECAQLLGGGAFEPEEDNPQVVSNAENAVARPARLPRSEFLA
jgi:pyruvate, water dikinase